MVAAGMSAGEAGAIAAEIYAAGVASASFRSSNADRQQRYRDRKRNETVTERNANELTETVTNRNENVTNRNDVTPPSIVLDKKKEKKDRGSQLPDGWRPDEVRWDAACRKLGTTVAETELNKFTSHHRAKGTVFKNWNFGWDKWLLQSEQWRPKTTVTTEMPSFSAPADIDWKHVLSFYKKTGNWSKWAGPDPDSAACRAPPELLREFGLLKSA